VAVNVTYPLYSFRRASRFQPFRRASIYFSSRLATNEHTMQSTQNHQSRALPTLKADTGSRYWPTVPASNALVKPNADGPTTSSACGEHISGEHEIRSGTSATISPPTSVFVIFGWLFIQLCHISSVLPSFGFFCVAYSAGSGTIIFPSRVPRPGAAVITGAVVHVGRKTLSHACQYLTLAHSQHPVARTTAAHNLGTA
jgi:hypothetical protein